MKKEEAKAFSDDLHLQVFSSGNYGIMEFKETVLIEHLRTWLPCVGPLSSVDFFMPFMVSKMSKSFPTVLTHIGLLASVDSLMCF